MGVISVNKALPFDEAQVNWSPITHADRIRAMSDEELAKWLDYICDAWYCPIEGWLEWLRQEVDDDKSGQDQRNDG